MQSCRYRPTVLCKYILHFSIRVQPFRHFPSKKRPLAVKSVLLLTVMASCGLCTAKSSSWLHNCSVSWTLATAVILIRLCADSFSMYSDGFTNVCMFSSAHDNTHKYYYDRFYRPPHEGYAVGGVGLGYRPE